MNCFFLLMITSVACVCKNKSVEVLIDFFVKKNNVG